MTLRIGSMCTGYGGLDMAVQSVIGGELAWVADNDPGASAILGHRFLSLPNLGDIRAADWGAAEPVDILTAGFPCQPVSAAGRRKGLRDERWLFDDIAEAASRMVARPRVLVFENVPGLLSADGGDAMARVVQGLAALGYVGRYGLLRASDAGAPHRRERWFCAAWLAADANDRYGEECPSRRHRPGGRPCGGGEVPADPERHGWEGRQRPDRAHEERTAPDRGGRGPSGGGLAASHADSSACLKWGQSAPGQAQGGWPRPDAGGRGRAPAADAQGHGRHEGRPEPARFVGGPDAALRSHRTASDAERGGRDGWPFDPQRGPVGRTALAGSGEGAGGRDAAADPDSDGLARGQERDSQAERPETVREQRRVDPLRCVLDWGAYALAIRRWEAVLGRAAPRPTEPGRTGERLSPRFVEFMMGLPEGWVTDVPGLSRNAMLKALGNGVVPQQAAMALRMLLPAYVAEAGEVA